MSWRRLGGILLLSLSSLHLLAEVVPPPASVPKLFTAADVVLKGEIASVDRISQHAGNWHGEPALLNTYEAIVFQDRLYKGTVGAIRITFMRPTGTICNVSRCTWLSPGAYGLLFLTKTKGDYLLSNEILQVSRKNAAVAADGLSGLEADLIAGLKDNDGSRKLVNIELLGTMEDPEIPEKLSLQLPSAGNLTKIAIYAALLQLRDYRFLAEMRPFLELQSADPVISRFQGRLHSRISEVNDARTLAVLLQFARSRSDSLRQTAMRGLRNLESPESVPVLTQALDDRVQDIRYDAVFTLATIYKKWEWAPSYDAFRSNEAKYISAWKKWIEETNGKPTPTS